jgi:uncharacterized protein YgiM (DUF1202 family)
MKLIRAGLFVAAVFALGVVIVLAQGTSDCAAALTELWTAAGNACLAAPSGYFCNGGAAPQAEPEGAVNNALQPTGAKVEASAVTAIHSALLDPTNKSVGILWLRLAAPNQTLAQTTALIIGDVSMRDVTPQGFSPWTSFVMQTSEQPSRCADAPLNLYIVQSQIGMTVRVVINGASMALNGTVVVRTEGDNTIFAALSGSSNLTVFGQDNPLLTGEQVSVPYNPGDFTRPNGPAVAAAPFVSAPLQNLPISLFDRPLALPQPGYVSTEGQVNLRASPSTGGNLIAQVPAGTVMSVLGRNPDGDWYHVRLDTGETGWMLAELLQRHVGTIEAVYSATPQPPQRLGIAAIQARVLAPAGVNLRTGPDVGFPVVAALGNGTEVELVARSPYSPWVKVDSNGTIGWIALIALQTESYIDALPVDGSAPPPPAPTKIPGSFGNAFPNPNGG